MSTGTSSSSDMWRTAMAVRAAPPPAEATGQQNLLEHFNLGYIATIAAKARSVNYLNPDDVKQFDTIGKLRGPPECKQLFRQGGANPQAPGPDCRWDLMPISRWPAHTYDFHPFPAQGIKQAFALQPGTSALPEDEGDLYLSRHAHALLVAWLQADRGEAVGPDRVQLAQLQQGAGSVGTQQQRGGSVEPGAGAETALQSASPPPQPQLGRGRRTKKPRRAGGSLDGAGASEHTT